MKIHPSVTTDCALDAAERHNHKEQMSYSIELVLPPAELRDWRQRTDDREFFDRGERIIMVNGERWGRTKVTWHGCNGTRTAFIQDEGGAIDNARGREEAIRSASPRHARKFINGEYRLPDTFKPTEQLVLEKIRQLIDEGKLQHPSIVREERAKLSAELNRHRAERIQEEETAFKHRAAEALRANDLDSEMVARVVEAMRWAQNY